MDLNTFISLCQAHSNGVHCGALAAIARRINSDHHATAAAKAVQDLHDGITAVAVEQAQESRDFDLAWTKGYLGGLAAFDRPMTTAETAATVAYVVTSLRREIESQVVAA
jgi:hypothetical protein